VVTTPEERRLIEVFSLWTPEQRRSLLDILSAPDDERPAKIGEVYRLGNGQPVAELLIDLEEDAVARATVASVLRVMG